MSKLIAVADAGPLRYLIEISQIEILSQLFDEVLISQAVFGELSKDATPSTVRRWVFNPPAWLKVIDITRTHQFHPALHAGECEAMELALSISCGVILMDERDGCKQAKRFGLSPMGTLGLLEQADKLGLLRDFEATVAALRSTNIRVTDLLVTQLLDRHRKRN